MSDVGAVRSGSGGDAGLVAAMVVSVTVMCLAILCVVATELAHHAQVVSVEAGRAVPVAAPGSAEMLDGVSSRIFSSWRNVWL